MLQNLNDDCLRLILTYLDLKDKIMLANTCQRLRDTIKDHFRVHKLTCLDAKLLDYIYKYDVKPEEFLSFITQNVRELQLNVMNRKLIPIARKCSFPKLKTLKIENIGEIRDSEIKKAFILILEDVDETLETFSFIKSNIKNLYIISKFEFPNVKHLTLYGGNELFGVSTDVDVNYEDQKIMENIENVFPNLIKLTVIKPEYLYLNKLKSLIELEVIFDRYQCFCNLLCDSNVKKLVISTTIVGCLEQGFTVNASSLIAACTNLEFVQTDCHVLRYIDVDLNNLRQVRKYVFTYKNSFFCDCKHSWLWDKIWKLCTNRIVYFAINSNLLRKCSNLEEFLSRRLPNLSRLVIFDEDYIIPEENMEDYQQSIDDLRNCILDELQYYKNLENFDVSANICNYEFLKAAISCIRLRNQKHYKPFLFRCFKTSITPEDLEYIFLPRGVQVELKNEILQLPETDSFEIEVTPDD